MRHSREVAGSVRGRLARACLAALFVPPFLLLGASAVLGAPQEGGGVGAVSKWRAFPGSANVTDGLLAVDVKGRTGFAFATVPGQPFSVQAWNLDTLKKRGAAAQGPAGAAVKSNTPYAVDEANHVVYVVPPAGVGGEQRVVVVGLRNGAAAVIGSIPARFPAGYLVFGIAADAAHGRLFLLGAPNADAAFVRPASSLVQVDAWKLADAAAARLKGDLTPDQPALVPASCGQPVTSRLPAGLIPSADGKSVTFGCIGTRGVVSDQVSSPHEVAGAARFEVVTTAATRAFTLYPIFGTFGSGDSFNLGGNWFAMNSGGAGATNLKVFDLTVDRWVGNVAYTSTLFSAGGNSALGRGYIIVTDGFGSVELGAAPVTQLRMVPELASIIGPQQRIIATDPKTGRVFVPVSDDVVNGPNAYLLVLQDNRARLDSSIDDDPDGGSLRTAEVPGKIGSARNAFANAVGYEYRQVGGTDAPCTNTVHIQWNGTCDPGTRYYQFAASRNVAVDNERATAEAVNLRIDDTTQGDFAKAQGVGEEPPAPPVLCQDLNGVPENKASDNAKTQCDTGKQVASAESAASPPRMLLSARTDNPAPEAVQVRAATSHAKSERLADGTTQSTATATAYGVDILGVVQIGQVTATAVTKTHGQRGSASATYQSVMQDVTINGQPVCHLTCKSQDVAEQINDAFDGRVSVAFSDPKKVTFASPGGVTARVAVDRYEHAEDMLVNDEPASSVLTPAMKIVVYGDGAIAQREIYRLALVSLSQQYRIVSVTDSDFTDPGPGESPRPTVVVPGQPGVTITTPGSAGTGGGETGGTPPATTAQDSPGGVLGSIINGLRVVLRSPSQVAGIACVWMLLALPAYLAARRRLLLELPRLRAQEDV